MLPPLSDVKKMRTELGITQRKLASHLGISQSAVAKIEGGSMNASYRLVAEIFRYLEAFQKPAIGVAADIQVFPVVFVRSRDSLRRAASLMQRHGFKQLPVKDDDGLIIGGISERGVSGQILTTGASPAKILRKPVATFMEDPFPVIPESSPIDFVATLLQHSQAVLTSREGVVHGIVTNTDLVRFVSRP